MHVVKPTILERLRGVQRSGDGWLAYCPAHDDRKNRSLSVTVRDGRVLVHCFAGCNSEQIVGAVGMSMADLFTDSAGVSRNGHSPLTLEAFARAKGLSPEFLRENGVREDGNSLIITYCLRDGSLAPRQRRRSALIAGDGSSWDGPRDQAPVAYGLSRLDEATEKGELLLVEGETDALTAWAHNVPCLGIPGADMVKYLIADALQGIERLYVVQEPDQGGETFIRRIAARLKELGWTGQAFAVRLPVKDLNALHLSAGNRFADELVKAKAAATPLAEVAESVPSVDYSSSLGVGGGTFLRQSFAPPSPIIEDLLSDEGGGWRGGEEKLGKSIEILDETICLTFALPVLGRFPVPTPRRVLLISEEDSPRRTWRRLRALLRGHNLDPDDPAVQVTLDDRLRVSAWEGFRFDDGAMVTRLEATIAEHKPEVVYLDVLRKLTTKDLNKADQASAILDLLDGMRRLHGCVFILVHHYRKAQGFRTGRGSQEIGGSFVLGAWGENSLFFEPIGRKQGQVRVEVQTKDGPPVPAFRLIIESDGPKHDPVWIRLRAEEDRSGEDADDLIYQAVATLPKVEALAGKPGVPVAAIAGAAKRSDKTVRRALKRLLDAGRVLVIGQASKQKDLYGVNDE